MSTFLSVLLWILLPWLGWNALHELPWAFGCARLWRTKRRVASGRQFTSYTVAAPDAFKLRKADRDRWMIKADRLGEHAWQVSHGIRRYDAAGVMDDGTWGDSRFIHDDQTALDLAVTLSRTVTWNGQTLRERVAEVEFERASE